MCGVAGIFVRGLAPVDRGRLEAMTSSLSHRGPDGEGFHVEPGLGLGHRRLSIIDLEGGAQPLANEDGTVWTVFNGEIYNYREIRSWLVSRGHRFRTHSDTEVIVHLYEELGEEAIEALLGMFALAVWDRRERKLILARDRIGQKPLYYRWDGRRLSFASELKALSGASWTSRRIDPGALDAYLAFGYVPAPLTIYEGVKKLLPGHMLVVDERAVRTSAYWTLRFPDEPRPGGMERRVEEFDELLGEAVGCRLVSDVPVGAFLSGGVDSSLIVSSMARRMAGPPRTVTVGFGDGDLDEVEHAAAVARHFGTRHRQVRVEADPGILPRLVGHFDEPFADPSAVPTWWLSRATREEVKVVLSGDGGDEAFGGYATRYPVHLLEAQVRASLPDGLLRTACGALARIYPRGAWLPRFLRAGGVLGNLSTGPVEAYFRDVGRLRPEHRRELLRPGVEDRMGGDSALLFFRELFAAANRAGARDPLSRLMYVDLYSFLSEGVLVKVDRMSMAHGLEVRSPLLDHRILEFAATVPSDLKVRGFETKRLLRESLARRVPDGIAGRPKQGFDPPYPGWLKTVLRDRVEAAIDDRDGILADYFDGHALRRRWRRFRAGRRDDGPLFWTLLVLDLWNRQAADAGRERGWRMGLGDREALA